jgi:anti-sigma regulatory factor (Ser/Thr protein kinase)
MTTSEQNDRIPKFVAELSADQGAISTLSKGVMSFLAESGVDARTAHHIALVLDELLSNVATHNETPDALVSVCLTVSSDRVSAELLDGGAMFDPRTAATPDLSGGAQDRPIGGLGLLLVHLVAEGLTYERTGNRNRTTFAIYRPPADR